MSKFDTAITGRKILLVEDEALVAMDIGFMLQGAGATVVGPLSTLAETVASAQAAEIDAALLDVNLGGHDVFPAAKVLQERGVPFVFHTGHGDRVEIEALFANVPVLQKPADPDDILQSLASVIHDRAR